MCIIAAAAAVVAASFAVADAGARGTFIYLYVWGLAQRQIRWCWGLGYPYRVDNFERYTYIHTPRSSNSYLIIVQFGKHLVLDPIDNILTRRAPIGEEFHYY